MKAVTISAINDVLKAYGETDENEEIEVAGTENDKSHDKGGKCNICIKNLFGIEDKERRRLIEI